MAALTSVANLRTNMGSVDSSGGMYDSHSNGRVHKSPSCNKTPYHNTCHTSKKNVTAYIYDVKPQYGLPFPKMLSKI